MKYLLAVLIWNVLLWNVFAAKVVQVTRNVSNGVTNVSVVASDDPHVGESLPQQIEEAATVVKGQPPLHLAEQLSYLTVCLYFKNKGQATGFFYSIPHPSNPSLHLLVIVSNRHATEDATETSFVLTLASNSLPSNISIPVTMDNRVFPWINHPDSSVDLSMLPIGMVLNALEAKGLHPYIAPMNSFYIPDDDYMKSITQTDEVIMIGYPGGLRDEVNNQPIFRKGILATSPSKNFQGDREFLIDMPVYWGSSGSPVLLFSEAAYLDRGSQQQGIHLSGRLKLIGINYGTFTNTVTGKVVPVPIPTVVEDEIMQTDDSVDENPNPRQQRFKLVAKTGIPNNIGIIIHASRLKEMEEMFINILRDRSNDEIEK